MPNKLKLSNKKSIQQLVLTAIALGLKKVIIAPGSRNGPLTISFNQHPEVECISLRDERSAGFFALGLALETRRPVALLCTSGSAALNFAPAIAEAFYLRLPLIIITADRPPEWIGQMDGQTIDQKQVYANYIRKSYTLNGDAEAESDLWYNGRCLNEGFAIATRLDPGPVHFNVPVKEPLFDTEEPAIFQPKIIKLPAVKVALEEEDLKDCQQIFSQTKRVMILVGQHFQDHLLNDLLIRLAQNNNTIVLSENTSNIQHPDFISTIDRLIMPLAPEEVAGFMPDLLITFGGAIVSKKIKEYLRKFPATRHWNVHLHGALIDTYQSLTRAINLDSKSFLKQFLHQLPPVETTDFKSKWLTRAALMKGKHEQFMQVPEYSDLFVFAAIYRAIPADINVHFSNSSPIRYAQLFDNSGIRQVHCNRGTSGIDGCTSTVMGAAHSNPDQEYLLITGDVAFFYDNNAFWNQALPRNCKIILINNQGGGIFRIIKGPDQTRELEEFFETKHSTSAKKLVAFYDWKYRSANEAENLESALACFFQPGSGNTVLEIFTPNEVNSRVLAAYFSFLSNKEK